MKLPFHAAALALTIAAGAQYTIIDEQGHVVGTLVTDTPPGAQLRVIGLANAKRGGNAVQADPRADRTFHPDYSKALTVEQTSRAWQAEADRLAPQVFTGDGGG